MTAMTTLISLPTRPLQLRAPAMKPRPQPTPRPFSRPLRLPTTMTTATLPPLRTPKTPPR